VGFVAVLGPVAAGGAGPRPGHAVIDNQAKGREAGQRG
jgi:hypothetical protein